MALTEKKRTSLHLPFVTSYNAPEHASKEGWEMFINGKMVTGLKPLLFLLVSSLNIAIVKRTVTYLLMK
jgi:hypothetical protein